MCKRVFTPAEKEAFRNANEAITKTAAYRLKELQLLEMGLRCYNLSNNTHLAIQGLSEEMSILKEKIENELHNPPHHQCRGEYYGQTAYRQAPYVQEGRQ